MLGLEDEVEVGDASYARDTPSNKMTAAILRCVALDSHSRSSSSPSDGTDTRLMVVDDFVRDALFLLDVVREYRPSSKDGKGTSFGGAPLHPDTLLSVRRDVATVPISP